MPKILEALAQLDDERDAAEGKLKQRIMDLETENTELRKLLSASTDLSSRRTLAIGFLISHLRAQGLSREQIDALTHGSLDLRVDLNCEDKNHDFQGGGDCAGCGLKRPRWMELGNMCPCAQDGTRDHRSYCEEGEGARLPGCQAMAPNIKW